MAELEGVGECQPFVFSLPDLGNRESDKIRAAAHGVSTGKVRALMVFAAGSPPGFLFWLSQLMPLLCPGSWVSQSCDSGSAELSLHPKRGSWEPSPVLGCRDRAKGSLNESWASPVRDPSAQCWPRRAVPLLVSMFVHREQTQRCFPEGQGTVGVCQLLAGTGGTAG